LGSPWYTREHFEAIRGRRGGILEQFRYLLTEIIMKKILLAALTAISLAAPAVSQADPWRGEHEIHRFHEHDMGVWRGGRWYHGWYNGVFGWYWLVGGIYYPYGAPVYPYPDPYVPSTVVVTQQPQVVVTQPPQKVVIEAPAQPPATVVQPQTANVWYYCESSKTYYPYVNQCAEGWKQVPATPPTPH
jgi:hypothetical protein